MELGFDWNLLSGTAVTGFPSALGTNVGTPVETTGFAFLADGLRVGVSSGKLQGFISALETVTDVTVLANPKILAVNKQEGSVLIGKNIGYRSSTSIGQGGVATQGEVKFLETGTMLVFRPYIADDGYIRMEIYPKDSSAELALRDASQIKRKHDDDEVAPYLDEMIEQGVVRLEDDGELPELSEDDLYLGEKPKRSEDDE